MKIRVNKFNSLNLGIEIGIKQVKHITIYFLFWCITIGSNKLSTYFSNYRGE